MSVQVGDWVVAVRSWDRSTQLGQVTELYLDDAMFPYRVAYGLGGALWCRTARLASPEEIAAGQLASLPGGGL